MVKTTKAKAIAAAVGSICTVVVSVFADDVLDLSEVGVVIATVLAAAGTVWAVFQTPNKAKPPAS